MASATSAYGTNGFHLGKPWDSADLGKDTSGRGNHWTPSGFAATDVVLDSPTNVYATLNPLVAVPNTTKTLANGNLTFTAGSQGANPYQSYFVQGTLPLVGNTYQFETVYTNIYATEPCSIVGIAPQFIVGSINIFNGEGGYAYVLDTEGASYLRGPTGVLQAVDSFTVGDVLGVVFEHSGNLLKFYKNGVQQGTAITVPSNTYFPTWGDDGGVGTDTANVNFGQRPFAYPIEGAKPLCTANLPAPGPAAKQPWKYYSCQTVVHDGATTAVALGWDALATDWLVRIKSLSTGSWYWFDTKRGLDKYLLSDSTAAEGTNASMIIDRVAGGFSLGTGCTADSYLVEAWRVAPEAGFDIQVGTMGSNPTVVSHALGAKPAFFMAKNRQAAQNWNGWHKSLANETSAYLQLSTTAGAQTFVNMWNGITAASVGLIPEGPVTGGQSFVVYLWSEVPGFSKFGSYTGNGSADGPFNYCGFTPASFTVKSAGSSSQWPTINTAVVPYNVSSSRLYLNLSNANQSGFHDLDVNANGVKVRVAAADSGGNDFNTAGGTYIYAAFAAHPLGGKRVSPATAR